MCWGRVNEFIQLLENLGDPIKANTTLILVGSATADKMYDLAVETGVDPNFRATRTRTCTKRLAHRVEL